jgi:hypothetical protein
MARKLNDPASSLSAGVDRLERVILAVKARQLAETHNAPVLKPASDGFSFSPDEMWAKNYLTVGIGPSARGSSASGTASFQFPEQPSASRKLQPPLARSPARATKPPTIGAVLAKPARRRSWLGRLVRGG